MSVATNLQKLAEVAAVFEESGYDVVGVPALDGYDGTSSEFSVEVPVADSLNVDGSVHVAPCDANVLDDGSVVVNFSVEIEATSPEGESRTTGEMAAYKDPDRLRDVYERYDTFREMRDALEVDVTPRTVRNHMVQHGIHEVATDSNGGGTSNPSGDSRGSSSGPSKSRDDPGDKETGTAGESRAGEETTEVSELMADGAGLPDHVPLESLKEIVQTSATLYEVQQRMGLERNQVHQILRSLNLLDLVYGRLSAPDDPASIEEIDARIRSSPLFDDLSG